jgi:hypothetical protein
MGTKDVLEYFVGLSASATGLSSVIGLNTAEDTVVSSTPAELLSAIHPVTASPSGASPTAALSGTIYTNEGATALATFNLPTAVAGLEFEFYVADTDAVRVVAAAGDNIRVGASVSATAGRIDNAVIGGYVRLVAINATNWVAASTVGTWTVT